MPRRTRSIAHELRTIRTSFRQLARAFDRIGPTLTKLTASGNGKRSRRKPRFSAEFRKALKLQGRYMGLMRGLGPRKKARVKKVRAEKGIRAAIAEARRLALA